jgi:altronate dehydratase
MGDKNKKVEFYGKVAKMPNDVMASKSINFLENIKVSKQKLWYILIQKQDDQLQMIKYNNKMGVNMNMFIEQLKEYYKNDDDIREYINMLEIDGSDKFSIIKNIPKVDIRGKKLISIITEDLLKLLQ